MVFNYLIRILLDFLSNQVGYAIVFKKKTFSL